MQNTRRRGHDRELFDGQTPDNVLGCEISGRAMLRMVIISVFISNLADTTTHILSLQQQTYFLVYLATLYQLHRLHGQIKMTM